MAATAFHLLTGSHLFPSSNPAVVISRHLNVPPPALADSRPDLAKLDPILAIGLAKRPQDRFKRCSDFAHALNEQIDSAGVPTTSAPTASAPRATPAVDAMPPRDDSPAKPVPPQPLRPTPTRAGGISRRTTIALIVGAVALVAVIALAIGIPALVKQRPSESSPTSSSPPTPSTTMSTTTPGAAPPVPLDYTTLLIKPSDIGGDLTAPQPPVLNPNNAPGVAQLFANADNSRRIGDTILIVDDPATAATGIENTKTNYAGKVSGTWQPVDVGSNGAMLSGTSTDKSQAVTVVLFSEGKALVNLEFDSAPNDPIDAGVATDIARKQDAAIKSGLPQ